jgi:3-phenylpropionate/trans-cinnamate dioxygenase ferredoxin reductase subunit
MAHDPGIVVIGAGQAALQLALSLRMAGVTEAVTLIGDEPHPPYSRPPLSKAFLKGSAEKADLILRPPEWFAQNGVTLMTGRRVISIDPGPRRLETDRGRIAYGKLVLATGTRPRLLPNLPPETRNLIYLRGLDDAERVAALLPGVGRVAVVGGGFIGLEFAAAMRAMGRDVTLIEAASRLMARAVSEPLSDWFRDLHLRHGVDLRLGARLHSVTCDGDRATVLRLEDGASIPADLVLAGVGVVPNDDLARAAGIVTANGIAVDGNLQTSIPGIFAIGDCASFPLADGRRIRLESVQNAVDQAKHLATILQGGRAHYAAVPWFWSDQYDAKLQIAGLLHGGTAVVARPDPRASGFSIEHHCGGRLVCVESVNEARRHLQARKALHAT